MLVIYGSKPMSNQIQSSYITANSKYLTTEEAQINLDSPDFLKWLQVNSSFRFECGDNSYRARKDKLPNGIYWYAYKKVSGKLHKRYIGKTEEVNYARLLQVADGIRQPFIRQPKQLETQSKEALSSILNTLQTEIRELRATVMKHEQMLESLSVSDSQQNLLTTPEYQTIANNVLSRLGLGKQSQAGKALDRFIKELEKHDKG